MLSFIELPNLLLAMRSRKSTSAPNKKRWGLSLLSIAIVVLLGACDSVGDFGSMNEDPTQFTSTEPGMMFTNLQLDIVGDESQLPGWNQAGPLIQSLVRPKSPWNFYVNERGDNSAWFTAKYGQLNNVVDLINTLEAQREEGRPVDNQLAATRILRVVLFHTLTDVYGDVPYFEAGKALESENFTPAYDPQSEIYPDLLKELTEAVNQLDPAQPFFGSQDIMYGGDVTQWQKFGNSMRLRLALRLIEVDPQTAQQEAVAALNAPGGVMTSNEDMALIEYPGPPHESQGAGFVDGAGVPYYVAHTLVEWLKERGDPRLSIYAAIMAGKGSIDEAPGNVVSTDPADQIGYPSGYATSVSSSFGYGSPNIQQHPSYARAAAQSPTAEPMDGYSKLNPVLWRRYAPRVFQTYAEVALMRAEAAARGWTAEEAEAHYNDGVRAAMTYLSVYNEGEGTTITDAQVDEYLDENPYDPGNAVEQINEQYWAATFRSSFMEGWANFRRSGYPDLEPAMIDTPEWPPVNTTGDQWPQRMLYPTSELDNNRESLEAAMERQGLEDGPRDMTIPVWWDAEPPINR